MSSEKRSDFHFDLPEALIAQHPAPHRDAARLLVVDVLHQTLRHASILDLPSLIPEGTLCVPNDVKVRHARLILRRRGGGVGEALLLRAFPDGSFEAMVRPGSRLKPGKDAAVIERIVAEQRAELEKEIEALKVEAASKAEEARELAGELPF